MSATSLFSEAAQDLGCWCRAGDWLTQFRTKSFGLLRCSACGGYRVDPPPFRTPESSSKFYTEYYARETVSDLVARSELEKSAYWNVLDQVPCLPRAGKRAADIGCGDGHLCAQLRAAGWQSVLGVDISQTRVARARNRYPEGHYLVGTLDDSNCEPKSLDLMVMDSVVEHLVNPEEVLARLRRFLSPQGNFVVLTPNMDSGHFAFLGRCWTGMLAPHAHIYLFTAAALRRLLEQAGFSVIAEGSIHAEPYRPSQFLKRIASGDVKGAIWRAHQEVGAWYGRITGRGPMLYAVARRGR